MNIRIPDAAKRARHAFLEASAGVRLGWIPEKSAAEWAIALSLFVASCLYLRIFYNYTNLSPDEGITLQGAQRILAGRVLYRDFFSFLTPGSYYWTALLFKIFGNSILVARAALMVYGGAFSVITYLIARRFCSRWNGIFATVPTVLVCLPYQFFTLHNWDSTLWACLALYCAVRFVETPRGRWAFGGGSFTAVTFLFEQSKGVGLALGLALGLFIFIVSGQLGVRANRKWLLGLGVGFAGPLLLTVAYFYANHSLPQMIACLLWPFHHYSSVNNLPFGYLQGNWPALLQGSWGWRAFGLFVLSPFFILSALPVFAFCLLAYSTLRLRRGREMCGARRVQVLVAAVLSGLLLSVVGTGRPDSVHVMYLAPLFSLVLGWMAEAAKTPFLKSAKTLGMAYVVASFAALGLALLSVPLAARYKLETRRGTLHASAQYDAFDYIQGRVPLGEKILVYPYQPIYYYLTGTFSISRFEWIIPDMYGPAEFQEMIGELRSTKPRVVLFDSIFKEVIAPRWPNMSASALAARDPVEDYIFAHYHPCRTFTAANMEWHIVFLLRNDLSCSPNVSDPARHP
jgi:4-amino-4-deoxy-L-arabinose transferase-like glycosyltransferase